MSAALVKNKTVMNRRSRCLSKRFNRKAASTRRFTFWRNRTGSIESSPLSIPLKKNETIQHQKIAVFERFDVKVDIASGKRVAQNVLHDIRCGDDPFGPAIFIHHDCHSLWMRQKELEQLQRPHRLGHKRRSDQFFGVMLRWIEQKQFYIDDPKDLIRRVGINRDAALTFFL